MPFKRLVRFEENGKVGYGDLLESHEYGGYSVERLSGNLETGLHSTGEIETPSKLAVPKYPVVFTKPPDALAGPEDDISTHPAAQEMLDYEGELTVVIGKDAKNVPEEKALEYVLGYTLGNDVSARNFQLPDVSGGQFCFAKSMDGFAPIGPAIVSTSQIPDPQRLRYTTRVNGEVRQETGTNDMIYSVKKLIAHLSQGTTLRRGTLIMTGTPSGVGFFAKKFLKDGDIVEVEASGIGKIRNKVVFESL